MILTDVEKKTKKKQNVFLRMITNNNGVSVKSFMLVWGAGISTLIIITILSFEWYLIMHENVSYRPNYLGLSTVIASIGTMVGAVVWGKVKGDSIFSDNKQPFGSSLNKEDML